jgi:hypothetical protein
MGFILVAFVFGIICMCVAGAIAQARNANSTAAAFLGLFFGPLGVLFSLALPSQVKVQVGQIPPKLSRSCPHCLSAIPAVATVCRFCQRESQSQLAGMSQYCLGSASKQHNIVPSEIYPGWRACTRCKEYCQ